MYSCQLTGSTITWEMGFSGHAVPYHFDMGRPILMVDQGLKTIWTAQMELRIRLHWSPSPDCSDHVVMMEHTPRTRIHMNPFSLKLPLSVYFITATLGKKLRQEQEFLERKTSKNKGSFLLAAKGMPFAKEVGWSCGIYVEKRWKTVNNKQAVCHLVGQRVLARLHSFAGEKDAAWYEHQADPTNRPTDLPASVFSWLFLHSKVNLGPLHFGRIKRN